MRVLITSGATTLAQTLAADLSREHDVTLTDVLVDVKPRSFHFVSAV